MLQPTYALASHPQVPFVQLVLPNKAERVKRWAPKVRTGCFTCRKRRIKCDEGKPCCKRCAVSGHVCGYQDQTTQPETPGSTTGAVVPSLDLEVAPFIMNASARERRAFCAFRTTVGPSISNTTDELFWAHDIPRACQVSPAIWHAVLALTTLRLKDPKSEDDRKDSEIFALIQYNKSINSLVGIMDQPEIPFLDQEVLLIASLICVEMAMLQSNKKELFIHAYHAIQLYRSWRNWHLKHKSFIRNRDCLLTRSTLLNLMKTLEASFLWNGATKNAPIDANMYSEESNAFPSVLSAFQDLEPIMSAVCVLYLGGFLYQTYLEHPNLEPDGRIYYRRAIDFWRRRYSKTKGPDYTRLSHADTIIDSTIELWLLTMDVVLQVSPQRVETGWDELTDSFHAILVQAEAILQSIFSRDGSSPDESDGEVSEVCPPDAAPLNQVLYQVAVICRDHVVRRQAIALIKRLPGKRLAWLHRSGEAIAGARMKAEEERKLACVAAECSCREGEYVCHGHRIAVFKIEFQGPGKVILVLWSREGYLQNKPPYRMPVTW